jgi:hypothetical protein
MLQCPNIHLLYITRENPLDIIVSGTRAHQLWEWFIPDKSKDEPKQITLSLVPQHVLRELTYLESCYNYLDVWLKRFDNVTYVTYENLISNNYQPLYNLAEQLGMQGRPKVVSKKQILNKHLDCIENLKELQLYFENTKWEHLFYEREES